MKIAFGTIVNLFLISAVLGSGIGYSHLYLFHVCLVILVAAWVLLTLYGTKGVFIKPRSLLSGFFLVMICWYAFGLIWSIKPIYTLQYLIYIILGGTIVFVIVGRTVSEERYESIYNVLKWAFLLEIIIALLEIFTPFRLPTSPFSKYAAIFGRSGTDFGLYDDDIALYLQSMPTAFHGNPNNLGVVMAALLPFFLFHRRLIVKVVGALSLLLVIVMTGSRASFIGAVFGIVLYFAITNLKNFLILCLSGILLSFTLIWGLDELKKSEYLFVWKIASTADALTTYITEEDISGGSISVRQQLIKNGIDALYSSNGLGVGGGGSVAVQERVSGAEKKVTSMHNFWIEVLVDSGAPFFLLFVIWYMAVCFKLLSIYFKTNSSFYKYHSASLFVSFSAYSLACVSASSVIYHLPMWIMFGMGLALINVWRRSGRSAAVEAQEEIIADKGLSVI